MVSRMPRNDDYRVPVQWKSGDLAYYYPHFFGPVPCRVLGTMKRRLMFGIEYTLVVVQFTAHRTGHSKGGVELLKIDSNGNSDELFTRNAVGVRQGFYTPRVHAHDTSHLPEFSRENFPDIYNLAGFSTRY